MSLQTLRTKSRVSVMGIVNLTDDSFSGDGVGQDREAILKRVESHLESGVDVLDMGAVSTRPGAYDVPEALELKRVMLAIELVKSRFPTALISIDTSTPKVMAEAISAGVDMINDVFALRKEGAIDAVAAADVDLLIMHMQGVPKTMQDSPQYQDVVTEVANFFTERIHFLKQSGVDQKRVWIDPGFGFGKSMPHNYKLLRHLYKFTDISPQICVGMSRKKMIAHAIGSETRSRVAGSISAHLLALLNGARMLRVHDVQEAKDAVAVLEAYNSLSELNE